MGHMRRLILVAFAFLLCGGAAVFTAGRTNDPAIPVAMAVAVAGGVMLGATFRGRKRRR